MAHAQFKPNHHFDRYTYHLVGINFSAESNDPVLDWSLAHRVCPNIGMAAYDMVNAPTCLPPVHWAVIRTANYVLGPRKNLAYFVSPRLVPVDEVQSSLDWYSRAVQPRTARREIKRFPYQSKIEQLLPILSLLPQQNIWLRQEWTQSGWQDLEQIDLAKPGALEILSQHKRLPKEQRVHQVSGINPVGGIRLLAVGHRLDAVISWHHLKSVITQLRAQKA